MNAVIRKVLAIFGVLLVLGASFFAWFFIEMSFDGCCGARRDYDNDSGQALMHFVAYLMAIGLIWLSLWWGWRRPKK